ncbi:hypothetical protein BC830DRAFT_290023 [Chytriomyces sp. MP71]|nr:hypothetical protein BC830DRAFT_290023 [Chytriomyces sp. MP71]
MTQTYPNNCAVTFTTASGSTQFKNGFGLLARGLQVREVQLEFLAKLHWAVLLTSTNPMVFRGQKHLFFLRGARTWESRRKSTPSHTASRAVSCVASNLDVARTCAHAVSASGYATFSAAEFSSGSLGRVKEKGSERKGNARRKVGTWREVGRGPISLVRVFELFNSQLY